MRERIKRERKREKERERERKREKEMEREIEKIESKKWIQIEKERNEIEKKCEEKE